MFAAISMQTYFIEFKILVVHFMIYFKFTQINNFTSIHVFSCKFEMINLFV